MSVARMNEVKIYSLKEDTKDLLDVLQNFGNIHISNLSEKEDLIDMGLQIGNKPESIDQVRKEISQIEETIDLLSEYENSGGLQSLREGNKNYSFTELMEEGSNIKCIPILEDIQSTVNQIEERNQEIEKLKDNIAELRPWEKLDLEAEGLKDTENISFNIGYVNNRQYPILLADLKEYENLSTSKKISEVDGNNYLLVISHKEIEDQVEEILRKNSFFKVDPFWKFRPRVEIQRYNFLIKTKRDEIRRLMDSILNNVNNLDILKLRYEYLKQIEVKYQASENLLTTDKVSIIEAYVPRSKSDELEAVLELNFYDDIAYEITEADDDNPDVPTQLDNSNLVEPFENLTEMYSAPKYNEIDPTPFLAPFYWLFFGMMLADFGYGLLLFIGTFILLRFNLDDGTRRMMQFFNILGVSTMIWGFIYGSIFGGAVSFPGGFEGFIDPASDYMTVMILSLIFGLLHMFTGLGIGVAQSFKDGEPQAALFDYISWYMLVGGIIYAIVASIMNLPGRSIAIAIAIAGAVIVVLFSARDQDSTAGRIGLGLYELYGLSSWIGDFVSYLRLLALGLSGAFIGVAINMIVDMMLGGNLIVGIFGIIILVGGHLFNLGLSGLSAYVHSLRLTFVEFFGKFYEGNGNPFNKFRSNTKYINIRNQED